MNITLRQLRVFRSVAQTRNFSRTGEAVGLTQPAVSRAIVELERALDELDSTLADVAALADADGGKVRVASSPTLSAYLMPACIATCAREAPRVRFLLLDRIQQDVLESVRGGEVDFGVVVEPPAVDDLHCEAILHDPFVLVTPPHHPLAQARSVRWKALAGVALVLLDNSSGSRRYIDDALAQHGAACKVEQELAHPTTVFQMVEAGIGLTVMPRLAVPPGGLHGLTVRPLLPRLERTVMLVRRNDRALSPVAERVWKMVSATVRAGAR